MFGLHTVLGQLTDSRSSPDTIEALLLFFCLGFYFIFSQSVMSCFVLYLLLFSHFAVVWTLEST